MRAVQSHAVASAPFGRSWTLSVCPVPQTRSCGHFFREMRETQSQCRSGVCCCTSAALRHEICRESGDPHGVRPLVLTIARE